MTNRERRRRAVCISQRRIPCTQKRILGGFPTQCPAASDRTPSPLCCSHGTPLSFVLFAFCSHCLENIPRCLLIREVSGQPSPPPGGLPWLPYLMSLASTTSHCHVHFLLLPFSTCPCQNCTIYLLLFVYSVSLRPGTLSVFITMLTLVLST